MCSFRPIRLRRRWPARRRAPRPRATIGRLDEDELFYLRSRGIPAELGGALLTYAFAQDVVGRIALAPLRALRQRRAGVFIGVSNTDYGLLQRYEPGVADIQAGKLTFVPDSNENGSPYATFTYQVSDGSLYSNTATVTINVTAVNDAPVAEDDRAAAFGVRFR